MSSTTTWTDNLTGVTYEVIKQDNEIILTQPLLDDEGNLVSGSDDDDHDDDESKACRDNCHSAKTLLKTLPWVTLVALFWQTQDVTILTQVMLPVAMGLSFAY
jgi:hypothetical protein